MVKRKLTTSFLFTVGLPALPARPLAWSLSNRSNPFVIIREMRAVIQRVKEASVSVGGKSAQGRSAHARGRPPLAGSGGKIAQIGRGLLVLLGVAEGDTAEQARKLARKVADLRIMADREGKMNLSVLDVGAEVLVISQFTLLADTSRGNRPSFVKAAKPEEAEKLYELFVAELRKLGIPVKTGEFGAYMQISLINDGPVTIVLEIP